MFDSNMDILEMLRVAAQAMMTGGVSASVLLSVALLLAVSLGRKLLTKRFPVLGTDPGAVLFTLALSALAGAANAAVAGSALSWALFGGSIKIAWLAMGGFATIRKLIAPTLALLRDKLPAKLGPVIDFIATVFGAAGYSATAKATKAGEQAVTKAPGKGIKGALGEPKKFGKVKGAKSATRSRP